MTVSSQDLVTAFPEFGNEALFPSAQVAFWVELANEALPVDLFGTRLTLAVCLYAAHNLILAAQAAQAVKMAAAGGSLGGLGAPTATVTSKAVGGVSKSMDVTLTAFQGAGPWNATSYGQRYFQLIKGAALGPFYVSKMADYGAGVRQF